MKVPYGGQGVREGVIGVSIIHVHREALPMAQALQPARHSRKACHARFYRSGRAVKAQGGSGGGGNVAGVGAPKQTSP